MASPILEEETDLVEQKDSCSSAPTPGHGAMPSSIRKQEKWHVLGATDGTACTVRRGKVDQWWQLVKEAERALTTFLQSLRRRSK